MVDDPCDSVLGAHKLILFACPRIFAFTEAPGLHTAVGINITRWLTAAGGLQRTAHHFLVGRYILCQPREAD